ncbi:type II secretion system F family protein [Thermosphaera chiliense]|uniref:Type II secretion system F family protein n=1 Tax=Thermosphaera chiliense TaxID=3402707 RepID=A0A7M1URY2_9CREN|nr:type II secretion system F family protein [Thermosphaera aggregans]QOR95038.1 type II secretion system F family protein [Thermosphaera aggregans]
MSKRKLFTSIKEKLSEYLRSFVFKAVTNKWSTIAIAIADSIAVYYIVTTIPYYVNIILGGFVILGSFLLIYYFNILKRIGIVPVSDDLIFILVHLRCLVTGNPPLTTLFGKVGETPFYKKKYSGMFHKLRGLIKNWGYSAPEALKLVARETPSKVDEMLLQRLSAIVATGGDIKEYLRIEYNTLFAEYKASYNRMIDTLRVVLGVYTTLLGALTFMLANLMLLGMIFGNVSELITTGVLGVGFALISMALLLYVFVRKPLFESKPRKKTGFVMLISLLGLTGLFVFAIIAVYLVVSLNIFNVEYVALSLMLTGVSLLPAAILVKVHEGRITEYDMFFPAFIRSFGEHLAVLPNMIESLKPLLIAELGKLRNLLKRVYARLLNRVDPRIAWSLFADESSSEMVSRGTHIFIDTVETGGDLGEAGALLSDHVNELFRLRASYVQVFKTFEITLYLMHLIVIILLMFVGSFINIFTSVIASFAESIPGEYAGIIGFFNVSPQDVSLVTNLIMLMITIADTLAVYSVNPGSKYAIYYYLCIMLIITGAAMYAGSIIINGLISGILGPTGLGGIT